MPSEQMQAFIDALRDRIPPDGNLTVDQHRAMHDALLARRPPDEDVRIEETTLGGFRCQRRCSPCPPSPRPRRRAKCTHV